VPAFLTGGAIYFFAAQAFGFAVGGHIAGRLLGPQVESRTQEEFRASGGLAVAPLYGAHMRGASGTLSTSYVVDGLFWPDVAGAAETGYSGPGGNALINLGARAEAARILQAGLMRGEQLAPSDRDRLIYLVASQARVALTTAAERVDRMQTDVQTQARAAADRARKTASYASLWIAFSLLFGAVVAVFSAISARIEDDRESWNPFLALRGRA
jgi:hypothetical protein